MKKITLESLLIQARDFLEIEDKTERLDLYARMWLNNAINEMGLYFGRKRLIETLKLIKSSSLTSE